MPDLLEPTARRADVVRRRRRLRAWMAWGGIVVLLGAAASGWWRARAPGRDRPLAPGWEARVLVVAGSGVPGTRDGSAYRAQFSDPFGIAAARDGSLLVADAGDAQAIRRIAPDGTVSTLAGGSPGYADGPAASARFNTPSGLARGADGSTYIADTGNNVIRRLAPDGVVSTAAGGLAAGLADGPARDARFNGPVGVAVDHAGRIIVADTYNDRIRILTPDGIVATLAGTGGPGYVDGPGAEARFDTPCGVAADRSGRVYVADSGNGLVRAISPDGIVSTVGPLPAEGLVRPIGIAVTEDGTIYVTDDRGRIAEIVPGVAARVVAGSRAGFEDGAGGEARFRGPSGLAAIAPGRLLVADARNALIRMVAAASDLPLGPPAPPRVRPAFDASGFGTAPLLWPLAPMEGPFEITGTLGEPRGGEGGERFHAGIDIHADEGALVRAVRSATVASPLGAGDFDTLNESVRIGPIAYVHLRVGRDRGDRVLDDPRYQPAYDEAGRLIRMRVRRGARFASGEAIGTANRFNHVHLNVGWPGEEYNPLRFRIVQFEDHVPPTIAKGGIRLFREDGAPVASRARGRLEVDGRLRVVVDAWDQVDGNEARRRLGLYELGYQVLTPDGRPAPGFERPRWTLHFDRLLPGSEAARIVYASGSGIPFYGRRSTRLLYVVTNTFAGGTAAMGVWDTTTLPPGPYTLRVLAADAAGNIATANRDVAVTVAASPGS